MHCGNGNAVDQASPNFFVRGPHKLSHNSSGAGQFMLCDCFGICCILPNQQVSRKYIISSFLSKYLCGPMK